MTETRVLTIVKNEACRQEILVSDAAVAMYDYTYFLTGGKGLIIDDVPEGFFIGRCKCKECVFSRLGNPDFDDVAESQLSALKIVCRMRHE